MENHNFLIYEKGGSAEPMKQLANQVDMALRSASYVTWVPTVAATDSLPGP